MEKFENKNINDDSFNIAVDTTYKILTGKLKLDEYKHDGRLYILYDPIDVTKKELKVILKDIIEHFIEFEEYEKCQEIKDILDSNLEELMPKITFDSVEEEKYTDYGSIFEKSRESNPIDKMIDVLRKLNVENAEKAVNRIEKDFSFSNLELWSIMLPIDREIFEKDYGKFELWANELTTKQRNFYTDRLVNERPLIPTKEEMPDYLGFDFEKTNKIKLDEALKQNTDNILVSFIDNFTCISNHSLQRIHRIKYQLLTFGILDSDIRQKNIDGRILYTLVYENTTPPTKLDWS